MNQINPSVTTPRQGDRSRASWVSPRNITGRRYAEHDAKRSVEAVDLAEVRRQAYAAVFEPAWNAGAEWAFGVLREAGVDVDAVLALDDEPGDEDEEAE